MDRINIMIYDSQSSQASAIKELEDKVIIAFSWCLVDQSKVP